MNLITLIQDTIWNNTMEHKAIIQKQMKKKPKKKPKKRPPHPPKGCKSLKELLNGDDPFLDEDNN